MRNWDSIIGIPTRLLAGCSTDCDLICITHRRFIFSPKCQYWLWSHITSCSLVTWDSCLRSTVTRVWSLLAHLHLVPRFRMSGAVCSLLRMPSWCVKGQLLAVNASGPCRDVWTSNLCWLCITLLPAHCSVGEEVKFFSNYIVLYFIFFRTDFSVA